MLEIKGSSHVCFRFPWWRFLVPLRCLQPFPSLGATLAGGVTGRKIPSSSFSSPCPFSPPITNTTVSAWYKITTLGSTQQCSVKKHSRWKPNLRRKTSSFFVPFHGAHFLTQRLPLIYFFEVLILTMATLCLELYGDYYQYLY